LHSLTTRVLGMLSSVLESPAQQDSPKAVQVE
jgi:hypothetical protein